MDYKLAKELKDAGFQFDWWLDAESLNPANHPTLSELIEACGELGVVRVDYAQYAGAVAQGKFNDNTEKFYLTREGKTPEEAVAYLWLALNKK